MEGVDVGLMDAQMARQAPMQAQRLGPSSGVLSSRGVQSERSRFGNDADDKGGGLPDDDKIAEVVKEQNAEAWEKRVRRWSEIREESLRIDLDEFAAEEGMSSGTADKLYDILVRSGEDRRYLHEAMMDGTMSIQDVRAEMDADREAMRTELMGLIGEGAYERAEEAGIIRTRRGPPWR